MDSIWLHKAVGTTTTSTALAIQLFSLKLGKKLLTWKWIKDQNQTINASSVGALFYSPDPLSDTKATIQESNPQSRRKRKKERPFVIKVPSTCCTNSNVIFEKALASRNFAPLTPTKGLCPWIPIGGTIPIPPISRTTFKFFPMPL